MRNPKILFGLLFALSLVLYLPGCKKNTAEAPASSTGTYANAASDNALAEASFDDIQNIGKQAIATQGKSSLEDTIFMGPCMKVTLDLAVFPYEIVVDFGESNCLCNDNKYRRGKIIVTFTGAYQDTGTVITHTTENYFVNDNQILGTKTVTNVGLNASGHPVFNVVVADGKIIKANNGGTITWSSTRSNEWIAGYTTGQWWDDVYLITGNAGGTMVNGKTYAVSVIAPLKVALNCYWIKSGSLDLTIQDLSPITVDYGDGTCDNKATATYQGVTYDINL